jgi:hypothetical protein
MTRKGAELVRSSALALPQSCKQGLPHEDGDRYWEFRGPETWRGVGHGKDADDHGPVDPPQA